MAASSPASAAAAAGSVTTVVTETLAGTRVLMTVDGYSKIKEALDGDGGKIKSERFRAGGHTWYIEYVPWDDKDDANDWVCAYLYLDHPGDGDIDEVRTRYELALLNRDGEIITSTQSFYTFSSEWGCDYDRICELNARPFLGDELFGPGKENAAAATPIRIDGMEPRVFRALLHFIYTESLPEVKDDDGDDKVAMAQGLLAAADRYGVERLKSICADMLCNHIDARTAWGLLQLANNHGCRRLKKACVRIIKDMLAEVATP